MQVPLIDRLNDLQAGLISLQNPSFPSQITSSSIAGIQSLSVAYNLCKWGAVILALFAAVGSIVNRVVVFIIRFRNKAPSLPSISLSGDDDDYSSSDDDDGSGDLSSSSELEDDDDDDEEREPSAFSSFHRVNELFRVSGGSNEFRDQNDDVWLKRRRSIGDIFSLSEIASGKSVVKLWDSIGFGLGLDFDDFEDGVVSRYEVREEEQSVAAAAPSVVVSAEGGARGNLAVKIWDTRLRRRKPTVVAEWGTGGGVGKNVRVESGGVQKVYVRDDGRYGVTVGDMRKVYTPLGSVTESDADAVIVPDESYYCEDHRSMLQTN